MEILLNTDSLLSKMRESMCIREQQIILDVHQDIDVDMPYLLAVRSLKCMGYLGREFREINIDDFKVNKQVVHAVAQGDWKTLASYVMSVSVIFDDLEENASSRKRIGVLSKLNQFFSLLRPLVKGVNRSA